MFQRWLICLMSFQVFSTEIDSFTDRDPALRESVFQLNAIVEGYFDDALEYANNQDSCDSRVIQKGIDRKTGILPWAPIEDDIEKSVLIDKRHSTVAESVYQDMTFTEGIALHIAKLGYLMRVDGIFIGSDKFGHFFQQGQAYFNLVHRKGKLLQDALDWGDMTERTYFGLTTTGIYSYGDLNANFEGMKFWERITGIGLTAKDQPYFTCNKNVWERNAPFDWRDYISHTWDEGINCSRYKTPEIEGRILARILKLEKDRNTHLVCPIEPRCLEMKQRYGSMASHFITKKCF